MEKKDYTVGKNVTLKRTNLDIIMSYTNRTRKNFSQTLNIIIQEWDASTLDRVKAERIQGELDLNAEVANLRQAKVIKT